ncbi:nitrate- and nitrite sensing domain-containing protein [Embleya sp. NBC_00896]|uniref:nitrate- and nitrite sensing domain-containing protein n=1 Tax=Embleya sp. NBC_00896 TaxID=2975961 RepID=UPI00386376EC|nr:nitrate- and nitrite sensing domain-containing protein [Embleya sp. NBC_00896]
MRSSRADRPQARSRPRRTLSIRTLLVLLTVVPSMAMVLLWGFASYRLADHARGLDNEISVASRAGTPSYNTMIALRQERRLTAAWMAKPSAESVEALRAQRERTTETVRQFVGFANSGARETPGHAVRRAREILPELAQLADVRRQVDATGSGGRDRWLGYYTKQIANQITMVQALAETSDTDVTYVGSFLVNQFRAGEALAQEDLLVTFAQANGRLTQHDYAEFVQAVGVRRHAYAVEIEPYLPARLRPLYTVLTQSTAWRDLVATEDAIIAAVDAPKESARDRAAGAGVALPGGVAKWRATNDQVEGLVTAFDFGRTDQIFATGDAATSDSWNQVYLLSAISFAFVLVGGLLCWRVTRSVRLRLFRLRDATVELGTRRLPDVVERLQRGEHVDVAAETPDLVTDRDEIGQVAAAFNTAQRAAVDGAVQLARERQGFAKVFVNTALRTQSLVNRQIGELDAMERRHQDPELLRELFTIDHLATRLRRYEENLVVLTGNRPGRRWSRSVRIVDVVRSAIGEVEDYHRVEVYTDPDLELTGPSVGGVIHLLAELIENATMFSPPDTPVHVRAVTVAKGLAIEIEDRGLGMPEDEYDVLNRQLSVPVAFDVIALADDVRLGLFVVAQLADRLGVSVTLRPSPYGGTLAIVFLPEELIMRGAAEPAETAGPFEQVQIAAPESVGRQHPEPLALPAPPEPVPVAALPPAPAKAPEETTADGRRVLPRRVRQAKRAVPLRAESAEPAEPETDPASRTSPQDAAATLSAFRRASERARETPEPDSVPDPRSGSGPEPQSVPAAPAESEPASGPQPAAGSTTHPGEPS